MYDSVKTAQKIKDICRTKGVTAVQLAQKCGSNRNIFRYIAIQDLTNIKLFCDIAQFLGVGLDDIVIFDGAEID